ncbi:heparinase II/III family protein [Agrococcus sp. Ld7]|uniref:heparinase II/III domain-containing protein n=1 Tax=Agrococcus sp. Ld7 TaxID=649148 RepID=UPI0038678A4B
MQLQNEVLSTFLMPKREAGQLSLSRFLADKVVTGPTGRSLNLFSADVWLARGDRSLGRYLHALLFTRSWIPWLQDDGSEEALAHVVGLYRWWAKEHGQRTESPAEMAFHDETTAQRLLSLLLLERAIRERLQEEDRAFITDLLRETSDLLLTDEFHSTGNNHGMFQDIALRNYSILATWPDPALEAKLETSISRLDAYFSRSFTPDGVHIENSPTYHLMISRSLAEHESICRDLTTNRRPSLSPILQLAGRYATHAILPTGNFVPISDTKRSRLEGSHLNVFNSAEFEFAATKGARGRRPVNTALHLPQSGYFYSRSSWGDPDATFIAFTAAYNANYHKHSDDLSILVWRDGRPILCEAGPYGYDYAKPLTKYAYSQFAHNNVVVNGRSVPRVDSAAKTVWMSPITTEGLQAVVRAGTGRLSGAKHERELRVAADHNRLSVLDTLTSEWVNQYDAYWNVAPDVTVTLHPDGFALYRNGTKIADARIDADVHFELTVHRGELEPQPIGWHFRDFGVAEATMCVRVRLSASSTAMTTHFRLSPPFNFSDDNESVEEDARTSTVDPRVIRADPAFSSPVVALLEADAGPAANRGLMDTIGVLGSNFLIVEADRIESTPTEALLSQMVNTITVELSAAHDDDSERLVVLAPATLAETGLALAYRLNADLFFLVPSDGEPSAIGLLKLQGALASSNRSAGGLLSLAELVRGPDTHQLEQLGSFQAKLLDAGWSVDVLVTDANATGTERGEQLISELATAVARPGHESFIEAGVDLAFEAGALRLVLPTWPGYSFSVKLYRDSTLIANVPYGVERHFAWVDLMPGMYRARVYGRFGSVRLKPFTTPRVSVGQ